MFEKKEKEGEKVLPGPGTVVGTNVKLIGAIKDINEIVIHGQVEGEVSSSKTIMVGETALIKGPVVAQSITVAGKIRGEVTAENKLELLPGSRIDGSISSRDLVVRSGAILNGKCLTIIEDGKSEGKNTNGAIKEKMGEKIKAEEEKIDYELEK